MNFGKHHDLVHEVVATVQGGRLTRRTDPLPTNVRVVSWRGDLATLAPFTVDGVERDLWDWYDFLEYQRIDHYSGPPDWIDDPAWCKLVDVILEALMWTKRDVKARHPEIDRQLLNDLDMILTDCALIRAKSGLSVAKPGSTSERSIRSREFWELAFLCVQHGLIPVGWSGRWPGGELVCVPLLPPRSHPRA